MINLNKSYSNAKQAVLPTLISDYLDICDPVLTFDRFMEEMDLEKYLREIPKHDMRRPGYHPVSMLKTVLFGFMTKGYISLRELEDNGIGPAECDIPGVPPIRGEFVVFVFFRQFFAPR